MVHLLSLEHMVVDRTTSMVVLRIKMPMVPIVIKVMGAMVVDNKDIRLVKIRCMEEMGIIKIKILVTEIR